MKKVLVSILMVFSMFMILSTNVYAKVVSSVSCPLFGEIDNPNHFAYYLQIAFDIIKFLGPVLVLLMSIIDLIKITADGKQDDQLQKLGKKTLKRIIYAALLFVIPQLLSWLLNLIGLTGTCVM